MIYVTTNYCRHHVMSTFLFKPTCQTNIILQIYSDNYSINKESGLLSE
jgi:hypothetical protein